MSRQLFAMLRNSRRQSTNHREETRETENHVPCGEREERERRGGELEKKKQEKANRQTGEFLHGALLRVLCDNKFGDCSLVANKSTHCFQLLDTVKKTVKNQVDSCFVV